MSFIFNITALLLCWCASCVVYLSSQRQLLISLPLNKKWAGVVACVCISAAFVLLSQLHNWLSALLILLVAIMLIWICLALIAPYYPAKKRIFVYGTVLTVITGFIGGFYVV